MFFAMDKYDCDSLSQAIQKEWEESEAPQSEKQTWRIALVDTAFDFERQKSGHLRTELTTHTLYQNDTLSELREASPILIELGQSGSTIDSTELKKILKHCNGRPMVSFLESTLSPTELCEYWQPFIFAITADEQRFLLRWADTRILTALTEQQPDNAIWAQWSAYLSSGYCPARDGTLQALPMQLKQEKEANDKQHIKLSDADFAYLMDRAEPDLLVNSISEQSPQFLVDFPSKPSVLYEYMCNVCNFARTHHMSAAPDIYLLAMATCLTEGRILENDDFKKVVQMQEKQPFADLLQTHIDLTEAPT